HPDTAAGRLCQRRERLVAEPVGVVDHDHGLRLTGGREPVGHVGRGAVHVHHGRGGGSGELAETVATSRPVDADDDGHTPPSRPQPLLRIAAPRTPVTGEAGTAYRADTPARAWLSVRLMLAVAVAACSGGGGGGGEDDQGAAPTPTPTVSALAT